MIANDLPGTSTWQQEWNRLRCNHVSIALLFQLWDIALTAAGFPSLNCVQCCNSWLAVVMTSSWGVWAPSSANTSKASSAYSQQNSARWCAKRWADNKCMNTWITNTNTKQRIDAQLHLLLLQLRSHHLLQLLRAGGSIRNISNETHLWDNESNPIKQQPAVSQTMCLSQIVDIVPFLTAARSFRASTLVAAAQPYQTVDWHQYQRLCLVP